MIFRRAFEVHSNCFRERCFSSIVACAAAEFQVRACDLASGQGCFLLGQMYSHPHDRGYGLPVDLSLARAALKKSCALKYADGCKALAQLRTSGR
jgi:TPR repeat protein